MLCSELMKKDVERCLDSSLVSEAACTMRDGHVGFLPVSNRDGVVVGAITDRDIVVRVLAEGRAPGETRVGDVMTRDVVSCSPTEELEVAEARMSRFRRSRIVVTDAARRIAGVISLSAIAKRVASGPAGAVASAVATRESSAKPSFPRARVHDLSCREIMKPHVECCAREDGVRKVAEIMRDRNIGFVPVCDEKGAVNGTVTDRDLALRVVAAGRFPGTTRAVDVMTPELICCSPDDPLTVAEDLMAQYEKSRILCVDAEQRPLGVVSLSDLARVERAGRVSRVLRRISSRKARAAA